MSLYENPNEATNEVPSFLIKNAVEEQLPPSLTMNDGMEECFTPELINLGNAHEVLGGHYPDGIGDDFFENGGTLSLSK